MRHSARKGRIGFRVRPIYVGANPPDACVSGADRSYRWRLRDKAGRKVLNVDVDFNRTSGALFAAGLIHENEIDDTAAVTRALERVIALLPEQLKGDA